MKVSRLSSGRGIGEPVRGPALVTQQGFGVRYDLEPARGVIANPNHDLFGHAIGGHILICPYPTGGVGASWSLADLKERGLAPLAMVFRRTSPIFVQGALFASIPIIHDLDDNPCAIIQTGDEIALFPVEGAIEMV